MTLTKEQFIAGYCERSGTPWEELSADLQALPCNCGEEGCQGWAMVSLDPFMEATHRKLYMDAPADE